MRWFGTSFKQALASAMSVVNFGELKGGVAFTFSLHRRGGYKLCRNTCFLGSLVNSLNA